MFDRDNRQVFAVASTATGASAAVENVPAAACNDTQRPDCMRLRPHPPDALPLKNDFIAPLKVGIHRSASADRHSGTNVTTGLSARHCSRMTWSCGVGRAGTDIHRARRLPPSYTSRATSIEDTVASGINSFSLSSNHFSTSAVTSCGSLPFVSSTADAHGDRAGLALAMEFLGQQWPALWQTGTMGRPAREAGAARLVSDALSRRHAPSGKRLIQKPSRSFTGPFFMKASKAERPLLCFLSPWRTHPAGGPESSRIERL